MRVRLLTHIVGTPRYVKDQIVELDEAIARAWIAEGLAAPAPDDGAVETATAAPAPETAMRPPPRARKPKE